MLKGKVLPRLLEQVNMDGIESSILMLQDGSLLGTSGHLVANEQQTNANIVCAIVANVWADCRRGQPSALETISIKSEYGRICAMKIADEYILISVGSNLSDDTLQGNMQRFKVALESVLSSLHLES